MVNPSLNIFKSILLYGLLPLTIIIFIGIIYSCIYLNKHKKKKIIIGILYTLTSLFTIYFMYSFSLAISQLMILKRYNVFKSSKVLIVFWIIIPIVPAIATIFTYYKLKKVKGGKYEKKISST